MTKLIGRTREGEERVIYGQAGLSVIELIRNQSVDELLALCGGCCSCATCHVYVDEAFASRLPQIGSDEDDLLDSSSYRATNSRLPCQIELNENLAGWWLRSHPKTSTAETIPRI